MRTYNDCRFSHLASVAVDAELSLSRLPHAVFTPVCLAKRVVSYGRRPLGATSMLWGYFLARCETGNATRPPWVYPAVGATCSVVSFLLEARQSESGHSVRGIFCYAL